MANIKTKKEAKEKGLRTADEWLKQDRVVTRLNGVTVKNSIYYDIEDTEQLISANNKPGFKVKDGAEPVKEKRAYNGGYCYGLYKESDFIPVQKRQKIEPQEIDILAAIFTVNRASKRYRDVALNHYNNNRHGLSKYSSSVKKQLYDLKDRGLKYAYYAGLISCVGKQGDLYLYTGQGYVYHSPLYPTNIDIVTLSEDNISVQSKLKTEKYRLTDAIYTLQQLDTRSIDKYFGRKVYSKSEYQVDMDYCHDNWDDEDWDDEDWDE
jgi:hypothetical protein